MNFLLSYFYGYNHKDIYFYDFFMAISRKYIVFYSSLELYFGSLLFDKNIQTIIEICY